LFVVVVVVVVVVLQISVINAEEAHKRVLPGLITLAGDPDRIVKAAAIQAMSNVAITMMTVEDDPTQHARQLADKIRMKFDDYFEEDSHFTRLEVTKAFLTMAPHVQASFRDKCM
jgi:hypothetical protein